jgi:hypothetical protein
VTGAEVAIPPLATAARLTPAEAEDRAAWVRAVSKAALTEGVDYGTIPGTAKPTLFKSGAEMLILAAGLSPSMVRLDDDGYRERVGVTYRCTIVRPDGTVAAVCDGYAGNDERRAPWNTHVKMAQKRALVGAALNACAASGLFVADLDDEPVAIVELNPKNPLRPADQCPQSDRAILRRAVESLDAEERDEVLATAKHDHLPNLDGTRFGRPARDRLAWRIVEHLWAAPPEDTDEPTPACLLDAEPESIQHGDDDAHKYDPADHG